MKRLVLGLVLLGACGGDEDKTPTEKCEALVNALCTRQSECASQVTKDRCTSAVQVGLPCGKAVGVAKSYDSCMTKLPTWQCSLLVNEQGAIALPADCNESILLGQ